MRGLASQVCERIRSQVSLGLDAELSRLEGLMVARHLDVCADCRAFHDGVVTFTEAMRAAPLEVPQRPVTLPRPRRARVMAAGSLAVQVGVAVATVVLA